MSSDSMSKCSLCFRQILVKNFKRHCERQHNTIDTEEKYKKQLVKLEKKYYQYQSFFSFKIKNSRKPTTTPTARK